jgi:osmotically-inducible protein OsmY
MICDKCKTEVSPAAKFCPACGTKIEAVQPDATQSSTEASPVNAQPQAAQQEGRKTSKGPLVAVILLVLIVIAGSGAYLYYAGFIGKTPARLGAQISDELKAKGLNLYCDIDKNWTATLKGAVKSDADKETAMSIIKAHKEVKDVKAELQPRISPSDLKLAIDNALTGVGLMDIRADVDENLVATLHGTALSESDKADAVKTAKAVDKVKDVKDNIQVQAALPASQPSAEPEQAFQESRQKRRDTASLPERKLQEPKQKRRDTAPYSGPKGLYGDVQSEKRQPGAAGLDPFELEIKINRALQKAGLRKVRARVGEHFGVFLNGRVDSEEDKARAIEIAGSFNGITNVRDRIVVGY